MVRIRHVRPAAGRAARIRKDVAGRRRCVAVDRRCASTPLGSVSCMGRATIREFTGKYPPPVQPIRRSLNSDQRVALLGALKNSGEPFRIILVYHHLNHETEEYANQFSAALSPERFAGDAIPTDDLPSDLEGVVVRVQRFSTMPLGAQRLVDALTAAGIDHRVALLTGQRAALAPSDYFDLAIGRMK
jgi:hypothetical protein